MFYFTHRKLSNQLYYRNQLRGYFLLLIESRVYGWLHRGFLKVAETVSINGERKVVRIATVLARNLAYIIKWNKVI